MNNKKLHITFDYELFFGASSGTVNKCMIQPANRLMEIGKKTGAGFVFFVDAGFMWQLKQNLSQKKCKTDYDAICIQLKELHAEGHEIGLHVHPHWEDSSFENNSWRINTARYKLQDFKEEEVKDIFSRYHSVLREITGESCKTYRAGGWCIQPFKKIKDALMAENIYTDSSVYRNGFHDFSAQSYDFRKAPDKTEWRFEDDECVETDGGAFMEVAITPDRISPFFYQTMYLKMKLFPEKYRPVGDGMWLKDKKRIYTQFYKATSHFASADGYFSSRLKNNLSRLEAEGKNRMVVLGHPKSMAKCSFQNLEEFIGYAEKRNWKTTTIK